MKMSKFKLINIHQITYCTALIFLSGCSYLSSTSQNDIIIPPKLPEEVKQVKESDIKLNLSKMPSPTEVKNNIPLGRIDPFYKPNSNPETLKVPSNINFVGIIQTKKRLSAFIINGVKSGLISKGHIGSIDTDLIPKGWEVGDMDINLGTIDLKYLDQKITLKLYK